MSDVDLVEAVRVLRDEVLDTVEHGDRDPPGAEVFDAIVSALTIGGDDFHETPSFFCRLDDDVVYWKRSFSFGLAIWNAA